MSDDNVREIAGRRMPSSFLRRASLTWAAVLLCAFPAAAPRGAELVLLEDECNGRQLMIKGAIEPGDYERFAARLAGLVTGDLPEVQNPDLLWTVKLDSPGGDLAEAMRVGRLLRRAMAVTEVDYRFARRPDGVYDFARSGELVCLDGEGRLAGCHQEMMEAECAGACLLVWLAGAERHASAGRLGLHGLAGSRDGSLRTYLAEMGVPGDWAERMVTAEPPGDGWLSWSERQALGGRAAGLEALIGACPKPLNRDESFRSVTAPDPAVRDRLMDRAEAHRSCRRRHLGEARAELVRWLRSRPQRM